MNITYKVIKGYMGFTDNIKEPHKTKVENILDKKLRYTDGIFDRKTYIINRLVDGAHLEKKENAQYYKRNGEMTKPKTEYRLCFTENDTEVYDELNKTEYDFASYAIENGYYRQKKINERLHEEVRLEAEKATREAEERALKEIEEQTKKREEEEINNMLLAELENISDEEKKLAEDIYMGMYGYYHNVAAFGAHGLIAMVHYFDNLIVKESIIKRLRNDNKASIKLFECLTGLKLPKSYKERITYLKSITSKDFVGIEEYKPRKKKTNEEKILKEKKESRMEICYKAMVENKKTGVPRHWEACKARVIEIHGVKMFYTHDGNSYNVSHLDTGCAIAWGKTLKECKEKIEEAYKDKGEDRFKAFFENGAKMMEKQMGKSPYYLDMERKAQTA